MKKPSYVKSFSGIVKIHYPDNYGFILSETNKKLNGMANDVAFAYTSSNPMDRRLLYCAHLLALIGVLGQLNENFATIRKICLEITTDYVRPKSILQKYSRRIPAGLLGSRAMSLFFRWFNKKISVKGHPEGFRAAIVTQEKVEGGAVFGIDILECGICKLFAKYQSGQFTSILCEVDRITTSFAGLDFIRSGTIAAGHSKCDFRYYRKQPTPDPHISCIENEQDAGN